MAQENKTKGLIRIATQSGVIILMDYSTSTGMKNGRIPTLNPIVPACNVSISYS